jgi:hypothetical protein
MSTRARKTSACDPSGTAPAGPSVVHQARTPWATGTDAAVDGCRFEAREREIQRFRPVHRRTDAVRGQGDNREHRRHRAAFREPRSNFTGEEHGPATKRRGQALGVDRDGTVSVAMVIPRSDRTPPAVISSPAALQPLTSAPRATPTGSVHAGRPDVAVNGWPHSRIARSPAKSYCTDVARSSSCQQRSRRSRAPTGPSRHDRAKMEQRTSLTSHNAKNCRSEPISC